MNENTCNVFEHDENNWARIVYWNELADEKLLARCYKVEATIDGKHQKQLFADKDTATNKAEAYSSYWALEEMLEALTY